MLSGTAVTIADMMTRRDQRVEEQQFFLSKYTSPVISFCLNIPGPIKTTADLRRLFDDGLDAIIKLLSSNNFPVLDRIEIHASTGDEAVLSVQSSAVELKKIMSEIEESHPLGRLFDIDVIDINGEKLSRNTYRKCLICDKQAQECARSRTHSVEEMQNKIEELLNPSKDASLFHTPDPFRHTYPPT